MELLHPNVTGGAGMGEEKIGEGEGGRIFFFSPFFSFPFFSLVMLGLKGGRERGEEKEGGGGREFLLFPPKGKSLFFPPFFPPKLLRGCSD